MVQELFEFVGVEPHYSPRISELLDPSNSKLNSLETYKLIPNIDEIVALGSERYGFLY